MLKSSNEIAEAKLALVKMFQAGNSCENNDKIMIRECCFKKLKVGIVPVYKDANRMIETDLFKRILKQQVKRSFTD